ncbi:hypothetical protein BH10ACI3_BH10ACI3_07550 [soil metagenome]
MKPQNFLTSYRALTFPALIAVLVLSISFSKDFSSSAQTRSKGLSAAVVSSSDGDIALSGTITGRVFQDFNANGVFDTASGLVSIDAGVAGVTVTAYNAAGASCGSAVTDASGNYSLSATGTGPYRLEFTTFPSGFMPSARATDSVSGGSATDSGSTVQFVANGNTSNVNLALNRPEEFCQNNPAIVISRFVEGDQNGIYGNNSNLMNFPYNSGAAYTDPTEANYDVPATHGFSVTANRTGTIFSLAYSRVNKRVFAASYFKRHAGFGPGSDNTYNNSDDPGAVYKLDPASNAVVATFTVPGATTNMHQTNDYGNDNADLGWDAVGKSSLGGMDLASDESRLFVMNLENRRLYALNPTTGASLGNSVQMSTLSLPTPGGTNANCAAGDIRPFAVKYYRGSVYVGVVCSGESTASINDVFAYVVQVNPTTLAFAGAPVFNMALNYTRGWADPGWLAAWQPWRNTITTNFSAPQPMFVDMEIDNGNIILGMRDRAGDQAYDSGPDAKRTAGDTLRACGSFGAWTLENNGRCGSPAFGNAPQGNGQGPGGGEFYHQDDFCMTPNGANYHDEVNWGSLLYVPGREHVLSTVLDPISRQVANTATFDGGLRWMNNTTGNTDRAYRVYNGQGGVGVPDFGKANGLGGTTAQCDPATIEIGNRIWRDVNSNGVQDAGEFGIPNVTVHLYQGAAQIGTAVTDANGEYYFVSSTVPDSNPGDNAGQINGGIQYSTAYQVRLDNPANFVAGGPLWGVTPTVLHQTTQLGDDLATDSDASTVLNPAGSPAGIFPVVAITTGGQGANDHTFDIGFASTPTAANVALDGRVMLQSGAGIRNVIVTLTEQNGRSRSVLTSSFGYYHFEGIQAGQTVLVSVASKRYSFANSTQIVSMVDNLSDINFVAGE